MRIIYMDNNATTQADGDVVSHMAVALDGNYGNASSLHPAGATARHFVEESREDIAKMINANPAEIYFTSGGTESNNMAIAGYRHLSAGKTCILTTDIEHKSVIAAALMQYNSANVPLGSLASVNPSGVVTLEAIKRAWVPGTGLVSVMMANNETGMIQPIQEIGHFCKNKGVGFHVDAVQAFGKIPIDVQGLKIDLMSISAHKIHGPKGVGALYIRPGTLVGNLMYGGNQERGMRPGTENTPGIIGFGVAARKAERDMMSVAMKTRGLIESLELRLFGRLPRDRVKVNGSIGGRLPNTLNISFKGIDADALLLLLAQEGIYVSNGSACASGSEKPSHVLEAMGLSDDYLNSAIRFSVSKYNTYEEVGVVAETVTKAVESLWKM